MADLSEIIQLAQDLGVTDFASEMGLQSLLAQDRDLRAELVQSEEYVRRKQKPFRVIGALIGGDVEAGRFSLRVGDDLYTGDVADTAKEEMRRVSFGANVEAEVEIAAVSVPSRSESQPRYVLRSVSPIVGS